MEARAVVAWKAQNNYYERQKVSKSYRIVLWWLGRPAMHPAKRRTKLKQEINMRIVFGTLRWDKQQNDSSFLPNFITFT